MAQTNFARLTDAQKVAWARDLFTQARDLTFVKKFMGDENSPIQRITELTKTEGGTRVIMQLVADLVGDGVIGDNQREGNEEELHNYSQELEIDQISNQVRNTGKLSDQATAINFRRQAKDKLAYWLADRLDQLALLTLSGVSYAYNCDGSLRVGSAFPFLRFASDVTPPSPKRHLMWNATSLVPSNTASIDSTYKLSYAMLVQAAAYMKDHYIRGMMSGGKEWYLVLLKPGAMAQLKTDPDYLRAITQVGAKEGLNSPFFTGGTTTVDGLVLHEDRRVFSTTGAPAGSKWGASGNVNGTRTLVLGAQALGYAEIGNTENWVEKLFDYDNQYGVSIDKMFGFLKPKFLSNADGTVEDFAVVAIDHYLG